MFQAFEKKDALEYGGEDFVNFLLIPIHNVGKLYGTYFLLALLRVSLLITSAGT